MVQQEPESEASGVQSTTHDNTLTFQETRPAPVINRLPSIAGTLMNRSMTARTVVRGETGSQTEFMGQPGWVRRLIHFRTRFRYRLVHYF